MIKCNHVLTKGHMTREGQRQAVKVFETIWRDPREREGLPVGHTIKWVIARRGASWNPVSGHLMRTLVHEYGRQHELLMAVLSTRFQTLSHILACIMRGQPPQTS